MHMEPYGRASLMDFVFPGSMAIGVSLAAWLVLPSLLRRCHSYVESGPKARLLGRDRAEKVPYHMSVFGALEDPARLFATAVTFSYLGYLVAPKSLGAQYLAQIRSGTTVLSLIWFLYLYKRNVFSRVISGKSLSEPDRERYLTMDRLSSIGLLVLGSMALAESCGVAVQSVMTVGGIGGVATAFAARDILGNLLSGISIQFSRPFSVGDYITAGSLSGQVVEIGLHTTQMLNADKFPTVVPNSYFSSQVIVNKSRVRCRGLDLNLPVKLTALTRLPTITSEVRTMLDSHPKVYMDDEKPRCSVSHVGPTSFNLSITCNLKPMSADEFLLAQEEVLLEASRIVPICPAREAYLLPLQYTRPIILRHANLGLAELCNNCKRTGHFARNCPNASVCNNCGISGHLAASCPVEPLCRNCKNPGHIANECRSQPICNNCGKPGHLAKGCHVGQQEFVELGIPKSRLCNNCYRPGHLAVECPNEKACNNCRQSGHLARECVNSPVCNGCSQPGHIARDCPRLGRPDAGASFFVCTNCNQQGHRSKDCMQAIICNSCGGRGHLAVECPSDIMIAPVLRRQ